MRVEWQVMRNKKLHCLHRLHELQRVVKNSQKLYRFFTLSLPEGGGGGFSWTRLDWPGLSWMGIWSRGELEC